LSVCHLQGKPSTSPRQAIYFDLRHRTIGLSGVAPAVRDLISHPESIDLARAVLAEHFGTLKLEPTIHEREPVYLAHGKVDFFGEEAMARTGAAGGPDSTTRALRL
jgi:hypothetical protein